MTLYDFKNIMSRYIKIEKKYKSYAVLGVKYKIKCSIKRVKNKSSTYVKYIIFHELQL